MNSVKMHTGLARQKALLQVTILGAISVLAFACRLFAVIRFESIIHEFDPWFNYRSTLYLVQNGFYKFLNWFDDRSWYPLGRVVGTTVYPGIMLTSALVHKILELLGIPIEVRDVCVFLAPLFASFTTIVTFLFTYELKNTGAGLLAAAFMAIVPGYISRSVAGSYDNECIAIFILITTFYFWVKAVKTGRALFAALSAVFYFYMASAWGGYVFITNMIPLHVFVLLLMGRFSRKIYVPYCVWYVLGTILSMQIPFIGQSPVRSNDHMAALGIFGLLQIVAFVEFVRTRMYSTQFRHVFMGFIISMFILSLAVLLILTATGYVAPWTGRLYSLFDTDYAKKHIPIIASVSEHQPTAWPAFFNDLHILPVFFIAGLYYCMQERQDEHIFVLIYAITSSYFAGVMIRLILALTPVVCVSSALAVSRLFDRYLTALNSEANLSTDTALPVISADSQSSNKTLSTGKPSTSSSNPPSGKKTTQITKASTPKFFSKPASRTDVDSNILLASGPGSVRALDLQWVVPLVILFLLSQFAIHCIYVTSTAYSSPSVVLATMKPDRTMYIIDDFREAYYWLYQNTPENAKIMAWWDYGYQITGFSNRTVLVDNNTWNNTHIATVGLAMSSREEDAYEIMRKLDVDYVLVIFGGLIGFSGDDINKFLWMVRIAEGVYPQHIRESDYFSQHGEYRVDREASETMLNSLMYKLSYYRFNELHGGKTATDRVRGVEIGRPIFNLNYVEEAFTSEHWIVRIYKVKDLDNLGRDHRLASAYTRLVAKRAGLSGLSKDTLDSFKLRTIKSGGDEKEEAENKRQKLAEMSSRPTLTAAPVGISL